MYWNHNPVGVAFDSQPILSVYLKSIMPNQGHFKTLVNVILIRQTSEQISIVGKGPVLSTIILHYITVNEFSLHLQMFYRPARRVPSAHNCFGHLSSQRLNVDRVSMSVSLSFIGSILNLLRQIRLLQHSWSPQV